MDLGNSNIKTITLVDQVEEQILSYIIFNRLTAGNEIPSELFLTEKFDVGRNVVREALSRLRMLGIVESRKHKGMVLREPNVMKCFSKVVNPYMLSKKTILDLLVFRTSLEIGISELIIENITDEDISELEVIVAKQIYQEDMKLKVEHEIEFHSKLYKITDNQAIIDFQQMVIPLFNFVNQNFEDFKIFNQENKKKDQLIKHEDLLKFLKDKDTEGYRRAITAHLRAYSQYSKQAKVKSFTEK
jgi:GntR family transcriptional regulator, transcriptional repressor for pyruvate dehydrogenase complex